MIAKCPPPHFQTALRKLDEKICVAADRILSDLYVVEYQHAVYGQIFLKYVLLSFAHRQVEIREQLTNPDRNHFINLQCYGDAFPPKYKETGRQTQENQDYYLGRKHFGVPVLARWKMPASANLQQWIDSTLKNEKTTNFRISLNAAQRRIRVNLRDTLLSMLLSVTNANK